MPGTKQLLINGPGGHVLGGWNYAVDTHLGHVLVDLETELATLLGRPIAYNIPSASSGQASTAKGVVNPWPNAMPRPTVTTSAFCLVRGIKV